MLKKTTSTGLAIGLAALICACGGRGVDVAPAPEGYAPAEQATGEPVVEVESTAMTDVVLYVVDRGKPRRLGMVATNGRGRFRLTSTLVNLTEPLQILAKPIAGAAFMLPQVIVRPGQRVLVSLMNHMPLSSVAVRDR